MTDWNSLMALKPSIADVHDFLQRHDGLIVHFSGAPPGVSFATNPGYPTDLHHVIAGKAQTGLACSIVRPTDNFQPPGPRNAFGCIGVILDLMTPDSLLAVDPHDAGSHNLNGSRHYPDKDITIDDLEDSLRLRTGHNEWGLQNYHVRGILAVPPFEYWNHAPPGKPAYTTYEAIQATFPSQTVYSFLRSIASPVALIKAKAIYP